jgi:anti-anti-sigma factor
LEVERGLEWLFVRVRTQAADPASPVPLADEIWNLAQQHFTYRLVLELDQIRVLNSYFAGQLVRLYQRIQDHDGMLHLCGLSPHNRRVLHACCPDDRLPIYANREEAVMGSIHIPRLPR